jgi:hypothetical protein
MRFLVAAATAFTIMAAAPAMASVTVYNATTEFNGVQGGSSGVWTYGMLSGGGFSPLTYLPGSDVFGRPGANFDTPLVGAADSDGDLLMHPGEFGELIVLRFTAAFSGNYAANFTARLADASCGGCGGTDGVIAAVNGVSTIVDRPAGYVAQTLAWNGFRAAGETIDFTLDPRGNYGWDSVRAAASVTTAGVPEPASWALLILGFGSMGVAFRRQRARAIRVVA